MKRKMDGIVGRGDIVMVDPRFIKVANGWNPRTDFTGEKELMESIIQNGIRVPLTVRRIGDEIFLVNGERRLRATLRAIKEGHDFPSVPCVFLSDSISDIEAMYEMYVTNDGKRFEPLEEAELFRRLKAHNISTREIATRIGRSEAYVNRTLALVNASPEVREQLKSKKIGIGDARRIVKKSGGNIEKQKQELDKTKKHKEEKVESRGRLPAAIEQGKRLVESVVARENRIYGVGGLFDAVFSNNNGLCYVVYNRMRHEKNISRFAALVNAEIIEIQMPMTQENFLDITRKLPKDGISLLIFNTNEQKEQK